MTGQGTFDAPGPAASELSDTAELRAVVTSLRRYWRSLVGCLLAGLAAASLLTAATPRTYQSTMTFFVATAASAQAANNQLQADEFAQRRINSYVGVMNSELLASRVITATGLELEPSDIIAMISSSVDPDTVLMNVTVTDTSPDRSLIIAKAIASSFDDVIGEVENRSKGAGVTLRVVSGPTLNPDPVTPRTSLNLGLGLLLGLGIGVAQALVRDRVDTSFHSREELARVTGVPVLALLQVQANAKKQAPILLARVGRSRLAEALRHLRTNLRFVDAASPVSVLVVTSSVESEGKSTISANLAQSFAEAGRKVLLIDGDLRRPRVESYLDLEPSAGLTNVLIGEADLHDVTQEWGSDGLEVLASGPIPPNPNELLGGAVMEQLLLKARADYGLVIIDTPPILPVADALILAALADGAILVVRHGHTTGEQVSRSLEMLKSASARVLGTVLSMAPDTRGGSSYYEYESKPAD
ncbi:MAG TPA: polysaccharide biosynthesis tyrosine autokinase [Propionicimonas sp.]